MSSPSTYNKPTGYGFSRSPLLYMVYNALYTSIDFSYTADVYIWQGAIGDKPSTPTYELTKLPDTTGTGVFNIQTLVSDYFINPQFNYTSWSSTRETYTYLSVDLGYTYESGSDSESDTTPIVVLNGYNYYMEGVNYVTSTNLGDSAASGYAARVIADGGTIEALGCIPTELLGLTGEGYWMTDRPLEMDIPLETSMNLFCVNDGSLITDLYLKTNLGDEYTVDLTSTTNEIAAFGVGTTEVTGYFKSSDYTSYEVWGGDASGNVITNVYTFTVVEPCKYGFRNLQFINRYGVWDYLIVKGAEMETLDVTRKEVMRSPLTTDTTPSFIFTEQQGQFSMENIHGRESVTVNTNWLGEDWQPIIKQFMLTTNLFDSDSSEPFTINKTNIKYKTALNDDLINYTLELKRAYTAINTIY